MGKGDKKTKRGKIQQGSYGKKRPRRKGAKYVAPAKPKEKIVKEVPKDVVEKAVAKPKAEKKTVAKKEVAKKPAVKKVAEKKKVVKKAPAAKKTVKEEAEVGKKDE